MSKAEKRLVLHVRKEYFDLIRLGDKRYEYRKYSPYWRKRLHDVSYDVVEICLGYPTAGDDSRRMLFRWKGWSKKVLLHKEFGPVPQQVYAIDLTEML